MCPLRCKTRLDPSAPPSFGTTAIMSSQQQQANDAEKNIEIWKVKKLIKRLEAARGNGTSMISLIIRESLRADSDCRRTSADQSASQPQRTRFRAFPKCWLKNMYDADPVSLCFTNHL